MRNPDLEVDASRLAAWNRPERRRESFRNLHLIHRRGLSFRAPNVHPLSLSERQSLADVAGLPELLSPKTFCGLCVVQGAKILFERCASDTTPHTPHSIQSITKIFVPLLLGRLLTSGRCDPKAKIGSILPNVGLAYEQAIIQDALDMNISSNFQEDYEASYAPAPPPGAPVGYAREEIAMGWRLPPEGEEEFSVRDFAAALHPAPAPAKPVTQYKSANTDVLGWLLEALSARPLAPQIDEIISAAGLEHAFHISADCQAVPVLSGGGVMTLRDLARLGLLFARGRSRDGRDMHLATVISDAMSGTGTTYRKHPSELRYRNHLLAAPGQWIGHPGYAGQFLMVSPAKQAAISFFSVLETPHGDEAGYFDRVMAALAGVLDAV